MFELKSECVCVCGHGCDSFGEEQQFLINTKIQREKKITQNKEINLYTYRKSHDKAYQYYFLYKLH